MKTLTFYILSLVLSIFVRRGNSLSCLQCIWTPTSSDSMCFDAVSGVSNITSLDCSSLATGNSYCQTEIVSSNGRLLLIKRQCASGFSDHDLSTDSAPSGSKCTSSFSNSGILQNTTCYYSCDSENNCNNLEPINQKPCTGGCGPNGVCDHRQGICKCHEGYTGDTCGTIVVVPPMRKCVQCDSESDSACTNSETTTFCLNSQQKYCLVQRSVTYSHAGNNIISDFVARACTDRFVAIDQCIVSQRTPSVANSDIVHTCMSTCDTDGCNTGLPDGLATSNDPDYPLHCMICTSRSDTSNCAMSNISATACPSGSMYCISSTIYYTSDRTDLPYNTEPGYLFERIVRGCASSEVVKGCNKTSIGNSNLKKVTCHESCQGHGCNIGWPARPMCSQCNSTKSCLKPPEPSQCGKPYHQYCTVQETNLDHMSHGPKHKNGTMHGKNSTKHGKDDKMHGKGGPMHGKDDDMRGKDGSMHGKDGMMHGKGGMKHGKGGMKHGKGGDMFVYDKESYKHSGPGKGPQRSGSMNLHGLLGQLAGMDLRGLMDNLQHRNKHHSRKIIRECSYFEIGNNCTENKAGKGKNCNKTCTTTGCNLGSAVNSSHDARKLLKQTGRSNAYKDVGNNILLSSVLFASMFMRLHI